jgi:predicted TIM-barrel fold metal-dependent hydrolase
MELREVPHVNEPEYDAVWAACVELGIPLCLHTGSAPRLEMTPYDALSPALANAMRRITRPAAGIFDVSNMLFSQILTRFPELRVVFAESALGWAAFMMEVADNQFERDRVYLDKEYPLRPSELFRRQCYFTGWYDRVDDVAHHVGADHILWASNLPLANTTWPDCQDFIVRSFGGVSETDRRRILWNNAARLYGLRTED